MCMKGSLARGSAFAEVLRSFVLFGSLGDGGIFLSWTRGVWELGSSESRFFGTAGVVWLPWTLTLIRDGPKEISVEYDFRAALVSMPILVGSGMLHRMGCQMPD